MSEGLIVVDINCRVTMMNQAAAILLHIAPSDAVSHDIVEIFPIFQDDPERVLTRAYVEKVIREYTILHVQIAHGMWTKNKNGEAFPITIEFTPLLEVETIVGAVILFRNVTPEKEFAHAKAEFLALASHQLRSPLTTTSWYIELLLSEGIANLKAEQKEYLERIYDSNQRMIMLVDQLLDISRVELGTFPILPDLQSLEEIVKETLVELGSRAKAKQIAFKTDLVHDVPDIPLDSKVTALIFKNLISYALYAASRESVLYITLAKKGENALFTLSDDVPQAEGQAQSLTIEMFRVDRDSEGGEIHSTGLELYSVHALVAASGGEVWITKEQNKTTFSIMFPLSGMRRRGGVTNERNPKHHYTRGV